MTDGQGRFRAKTDENLRACGLPNREVPRPSDEYIRRSQVARYRIVDLSLEPAAKMYMS